MSSPFDTPAQVQAKALAALHGDSRTGVFRDLVRAEMLRAGGARFMVDIDHTPGAIVDLIIGELRASGWVVKRDGSMKNESFIDVSPHGVQIGHGPGWEQLNA